MQCLRLCLAFLGSLGDVGRSLSPWWRVGRDAVVGLGGDLLPCARASSGHVPL